MERLRTTRIESPAAHTQSGTPRKARIAQIIATTSLTSGSRDRTTDRGRRYPNSAGDADLEQPVCRLGPDPNCRIGIARDITPGHDRDLVLCPTFSSG